MDNKQDANVPGFPSDVPNCLEKWALQRTQLCVQIERTETQLSPARFGSHGLWKESGPPPGSVD